MRDGAALAGVTRVGCGPPTVETQPAVGVSGHSGRVSKDQRLNETSVNHWVAPAQADAVRRDAIALAKFAVGSPDLRDDPGGVPE